jgi:hypothetical protein
VLVWVGRVRPASAGGAAAGGPAAESAESAEQPKAKPGAKGKNGKVVDADVEIVDEDNGKK